jgi:hypothetical protein
MGGVVDKVGSAAGIGPIFGNDEESGWLGAGQYKAKQSDVDQKTFSDNANYQKDRDAMDAARGRSAPTAQNSDMNTDSVRGAQGTAYTAQQGNAGNTFDRNAQTSQNYAQYGGAKVQGGNYNQQATQLGSMQNAKAAEIGAMQNAQAPTWSASAQGANIDQSQQAQFRNQQGQLANMQMEAAQGRGPSIANMQLQQGLGANLQAQMAAAQSQRGFGNAGASQRNLANNAAQANMQTQQAAAQMRVGETLAARQQLADLSATARGQDIGLAQNQAQLTQQNQQFNAANQQQAALANQGYSNQATMQQAAFQQQVELANQQAQNTGTLTQAQLSQQQALANQQYQNQIAAQNASMEQQAGIFTAGNQQQMYQQNLANQQQQNLANQNAQMQATGWNQNAANQYGMQQAANQQQTNLANQQSQLTNNQQSNQVLGMETQGDFQSQQNAMSYYQLQAQQQANANSVNQASYGNAQKNKTGIMSSIASAVGSDENMKTDISKLGSTPDKDDSKPDFQNSMNKFSKGMEKNKDYSLLSPIGVDKSNVIPPVSSLSMSDKKNKNVSKEDPQIKEFLDNIHGYEYKYKDASLPGTDEKTHFSPMAQELEKSDIGKSMVYDTPQGKMVDYKRGLGAMLAVQAELNERIKKLEGKK